MLRFTKAVTLTGAITSECDLYFLGDVSGCLEITIDAPVTATSILGFAIATEPTKTETRTLRARESNTACWKWMITDFIQNVVGTAFHRRPGLAMERQPYFPTKHRTQKYATISANSKKKG